MLIERVKAEPKFTPGPWVAHYQGVYANGGVDTYSGAVLGRVATAEPLSASDEDGRFWTASGCEEANAHLIAAAPELYNAVRALLKLHEAHHNEPLHAQAREILAKAEGKAGEGDQC